MGTDRATKRRVQTEQTQRFFEHWLGATAAFPLEEKGAYAELCASVIQAGKPIQSDAIKRILGINERKWTRIRNFFLAAGLIEIDADGNIMPIALRGRIYKTGYRYKKDYISAELRWKVFLRDGHKCLYCGSRTDLTADHVVPEIEGGETIIENLQTLCRTCNGTKGVRS